MKTTTERPDYEIAKAEMLALWPELGLTATVAALGLRTDGENWKHYAFNLNFQQTKWGGKAADFDWRQGTGIKEKPLPVEVLACCCRDWLDAQDSFEEWAGNFGYDTDSRKAERIYQHCLATGDKLKLILTREQITKLAELSARL